MAVTPCWKSLVARCTAPMPTSSCRWLIWAKLERRLGASLPRRCAYPSVCGYVSLMSTQKTATGCELTLDLRDDSGHRAPWHETSEARAMAQLSLQYPDCLVESISSHCLRLIGTRSPEIDRMAFLRGVVLMGLRPGSPTGDSVVSNRVFYLATQERDCHDSPGLARY